MINPRLATLARILCVGAVLLLGGCTFDILSPKGDIGAQEKTLLITATLLMLIVVVPVMILTLAFAWKYRASNTKATYAPEWSHSTIVEVVVWGIPCIIIAILGVITWKSTHALDPYRPIASETPPVRIEVVSLDWKWLFIYPDYGIATVNEIAFPVDVPVAFRITSDSVMNSFFIPRLGSQIYSMAGMETKLHLIAREEGTYRGISANYSGGGFSGMRFSAIATSREGFDDWVARVRSTDTALTYPGFEALTKPTSFVEPTYFADTPPQLFDYVIHKHMNPSLAALLCTPETPVAGIDTDVPVLARLTAAE